MQREILRGFPRYFKSLWSGLVFKVFKLQSYGIEGSVLRLLKDYLTGRQQRVVLNGKTSSQLNLTASVPQSSVLEPLLFLIAINNFPDDIA